MSALLPALALVLSSAAAQEPTDPADQPPTIAVTGTGRVAVPPDQAVVRLGATIQDEDAAAAQERLNTVMQLAIESIRDLGIAEADVQTSSLSLSPVYAEADDLRSRADAELRRRSDEPRIVGYRATNVVRVTVEDLSMVGDVIDAGIAAGVNEIRGIAFGLQNDLPQRLDALRRAVEEATRKAEAMASALGVTLVGPLEVREQGIAVPYAEFDSSFARTALSGAATPVEPGEVAVEANVSARFLIDTAGFLQGSD